MGPDRLPSSVVD